VYAMLISSVWFVNVNGYYLVTVPFALTHAGWYNNETYKCDNFTQDLLIALKDNGFRAHYVIGRVNNSSVTHAWVAIENKGKIIQIEPQSGLPPIANYTVNLYDPPICWMNQYTNKTNETICPVVNATDIVLPGEEARLFSLDYATLK
jgi:hypothetical protein